MVRTHVRSNGSGVKMHSAVRAGSVGRNDMQIAGSVREHVVTEVDGVMTAGATILKLQSTRRTGERVRTGSASAPWGLGRPAASSSKSDMHKSFRLNAFCYKRQAPGVGITEGRVSAKLALGLCGMGRLHGSFRTTRFRVNQACLCTTSYHRSGRRGGAPRRLRAWIVPQPGRAAASTADWLAPSCARRRPTGTCAGCWPRTARTTGRAGLAEGRGSTWCLCPSGGGRKDCYTIAAINALPWRMYAAWRHAGRRSSTGDGPTSMNRLTSDMVA